MNNDEWKLTIKEMVQRVGLERARALLIMAGIAPSTAQFMVTNKYESSPKSLTQDLINKADALSKEKAS